jgi:cell division protein FtsX
MPLSHRASRGQASALFVVLPFFAHFVVCAVLIALIMAAVSTSKHVSFYQIAWRNVAEDCHLQE